MPARPHSRPRAQRGWKPGWPGLAPNWNPRPQLSLPFSPRAVATTKPKPSLPPLVHRILCINPPIYLASCISSSWSVSPSEDFLHPSPISPSLRVQLLHHNTPLFDTHTLLALVCPVAPPDTKLPSPKSSSPNPTNTLLRGRQSPNHHRRFEQSNNNSTLLGFRCLVSLCIALRLPDSLSLPG
jgi:hypothetical protein